MLFMTQFGSDCLSAPEIAQQHPFHHQDQMTDIRSVCFFFFLQTLLSLIVTVLLECISAKNVYLECILSMLKLFRDFSVLKNE